MTPVYVYMVKGLENAGFVQDELDEIARLKGVSALPSSSNPQAADAVPSSSSFGAQRAEDKQHPG